MTTLLLLMLDALLAAENEGTPVSIGTLGSALMRAGFDPMSIAVVGASMTEQGYILRDGQSLSLSDEGRLAAAEAAEVLNQAERAEFDPNLN